MQASARSWIGWGSSGYPGAAAAERLFGVTAPGSGDLEDIAMDTLLADSGMRRVLDFVEEAIASVTTDAPTAADVARLAQLAQAIAP
jgi:hypothetical protein